VTHFSAELELDAKKAVGFMGRIDQGTERKGLRNVVFAGLWW
jgi:hypothetical protein